jgi:septal ring factor EnvC (AmiA/AmiB activator)
MSAEYDDMERNAGKLKNSAQRAVELQQEMEETRKLLDKAVKQIAVLEEKLQATEYERNGSISKLLESNVQTYKLQKTLYAAVKSVKEALEVKYMYC